MNNKQKPKAVKLSRNYKPTEENAKKLKQYIAKKLKQSNMGK